MAIQSFFSASLKTIFDGQDPGKGFPPDLVSVTERKLLMLDAAVTLNDLRTPPKNKLEALKGDREGQHSIRVNDQFRICFIWTSAGPTAVEFTDYHD